MHQPLFILAPPRSFTSIACAMIGNHPQLCGLPETNLFAADTIGGLLRIHARQPRFAYGLLRAVAELGLGGQTEDNVESAREWIEEQSALPTADVFADLAEWAAPRNLVDKSPMHVYSAEAIQRMKRAFPEARFLHLLREPRGTCESIYKTSQAVAARRPGVGAAAGRNLTPDKMWLAPHLGVLDSLEDVPQAQKLTLRGEELLSDPAPHLAAIAQWLTIDDGDEAVAAMMRPEESPFACMGPANAPMGNDLNFLKSPALRPYSPKPVDLDAPMSWDDELVFSDDVRELAQLFGYG